MTPSESEHPDSTGPQWSHEAESPPSTTPYRTPPQRYQAHDQEPAGQSPPAAYGQPVPYGPPPGYPGGQQHPMAYGYPGPGFGVQPGTGLPYSDKSKTTAGLLQLLLPFVGIAGVGRLYAGHTAIGLIQLIGLFAGYALIVVLIGLVIAPLIWVWAVIDGIVMLAGNPTDAQGRPLRP